MTTKTLTAAVLAVVQKNSKRGVTVPEMVTKLNNKFPYGLANDDSYFFGFDRQTVSSRVADLSNTGNLVAINTRVNKDTGRRAIVYTVPASLLERLVLDTSPITEQ